MPSRRRSIEAGQPADAPPGKAAPAPAAAEKRRSIPRPNLETAIRLKSYVGNAIDHASSVPAWLASKAVPVAADGAGLLKHAAADAVDRVALFRRGTQYDELLEDEDEAAKRRGSSPAGPSQQQQQQPAQAPPTGAGAQPATGGTPPDAGMGPLQSGQLAAGQAGAGGNASSGSAGLPLPQQQQQQQQRASPTGPQRAGQAAAAAELPAMITFDEDGDEGGAAAASGHGAAGAPATDPVTRPASASSTVSASTSDLLLDGPAPLHHASNSAWGGGGATTSGAHRTPPPPPPAPCSTPISRASPSAWATPLGTPSPSQTRPASSAPYLADGNGNGAASPAAAGGPGAGGPRSSKGARQALSYVSDDSAMEAPVLARSSNGSGAWQGAPLPAALLANGSDAVGRPSPSRPPATKGTPPPPRPSRPPPPPPALEHDPPLAVVSRRSSASSVAEAPKLAPPLRPRSDSDPAAPPDPASWDIFEPRAAEAPAAAHAAPASHAAPPLPNGAHHARPNGAAGGQLDLQALKALSGKQLLDLLAAGAPVRKKWAARMSPEQAAAAPKTLRVLRCFLRDGKVCLRYAHQGVKGLLEREEVSASVQRVEVPGGNWRPGYAILVSTSRGLLALEPPGPAAFSQWALGLNVALAAAQARRREQLLASLAHLIPRDSMFVVVEPAPPPKPPAAQ